MSLFKPVKFKDSDIMRSINALTYGTKCLYSNKQSRTPKQCMIFIHNQYINILVVMLAKDNIHFIKLNQIQDITDQNEFIGTKLKEYGLSNFLILTNKLFDVYVFSIKTELEKNIIWEGLQFFVIEGIMFFTRIEEVNPFKAESMLMFLKYDKKGEKKLRLDDILNILNDMKIVTSKNQVLELIHEINEDYYKYYNIKKPPNFHKDHLEFQTFEKLIKYYSRKQVLLQVFKESCVLFDTNKGHYKTAIRNIQYFEKPLMSIQQFMHFKKQQHFENISEEQAKEILETYHEEQGSKDTKDKKHNISFFNFCNYVFSPKNSIFDPKKTVVYQDMTQPLADYYIYSSHNTYLSGDQLKSDSKTEMYEYALKKGCRCVELDIHDGKDNVPIVKHGGTITKPINFEDTIKTIAHYSFLTNKYPVVLSFENHCSKDEQIKMAEHIEKNMAGMVYVLPTKKKDYLDIKAFPSPEAMIGKIVIKGDGRPDHLYSNEDNNEFIMDYEGEEEEEDEGKEKIKQVETKKNFNFEGLIKKKEKKEVKKPIKHEIKLMKLVTMFNSKLDLKEFNRLCWNSCSLDQAKVVSLKDTKQQDILRYSGQFLIRTYPAGHRMDSSNYDPTPAFNIGAHIIALNLQTPDKHHYLLHSKFLENGGTQCGYLLKPQWMRSSCKQRKTPSQFNKPVAKLNINVIAGQKLIIKQKLRTPLRLQVYIKGNAFDEKNTVYKSEGIEENAFNPVFNLKCSFDICCPDLAMLVFDVVSAKSDEILSSVGVNYNCIRNGLRVAPLLGENMLYGKGSYLLVFVENKAIEEHDSDQF